MKAYEAAKKLKMENKVFLEEYGIKSHLSKLSEELVAELFGEEKKIKTEQPGAPEVDTGEADVVIPAPAVKEDCPYTPEQIVKSIRMLGNKSPCWKWRDKLG